MSWTDPLYEHIADLGTDQKSEPFRQLGTHVRTFRNGLGADSLAGEIGARNALQQWLESNWDQATVSDEEFIRQAELYSAKDYALIHLERENPDLVAQAVQMSEAQEMAQAIESVRLSALGGKAIDPAATTTSYVDNLPKRTPRVNATAPGSISSRGSNTCYLRAALIQLHFAIPDAEEQLKANEPRANRQERILMESLRNIVHKLNNGQGATCDDTDKLFAAMASWWTQDMDEQNDATEFLNLLKHNTGLKMTPVFYTQTTTHQPIGEWGAESYTEAPTRFPCHSIETSAGEEETEVQAAELLNNFLQEETFQQDEEGNIIDMIHIDREFETPEGRLITQEIIRTLGNGTKSTRPVKFDDFLQVGDKLCFAKGAMVHRGPNKSGSTRADSSSGHWFTVMCENDSWYVYENGSRVRLEDMQGYLSSGYNWEDIYRGVSQILWEEVS